MSTLRTTNLVRNLHRVEIDVYRGMFQHVTPPVMYVVPHTTMLVSFHARDRFAYSALSDDVRAKAAFKKLAIQPHKTSKLLHHTYRSCLPTAYRPSAVPYSHFYSLQPHSPFHCPVDLTLAARLGCSRNVDTRATTVGWHWRSCCTFFYNRGRQQNSDAHQQAVALTSFWILFSSYGARKQAVLRIVDHRSYVGRRLRALGLKTSVVDCRARTRRVATTRSNQVVCEVEPAEKQRESVETVRKAGRRGGSSVGMCGVQQFSSLRQRVVRTGGAV